jgi:hypothetical protein
MTSNYTCNRHLSHQCTISGHLPIPTDEDATGAVGKGSAEKSDFSMTIVALESVFAGARAAGSDFSHPIRKHRVSTRRWHDA